MSADRINFYGLKNEYGCFSNFYAAPITVDGKIWPTTEHYFQGQKFAPTDPDAEEEIRLCKTPGGSKRLGSSSIFLRICDVCRKKPLRSDWEDVKDGIMKKAVLEKFSQHEDLKETLLSTGDKLLVEHTTNDSYWGDGGDGKGRNQLGITLMEVREILRGDVEGGKEEKC